MMALIAMVSNVKLVSPFSDNFPNRMIQNALNYKLFMFIKSERHYKIEIHFCHNMLNLAIDKYDFNMNRHLTF